MNEQQRLFLIQSRSDFAVFELLRKDHGVAPCHLLHYLQMTTEMLGKAHSWKTGPNFGSHRAIVGILRSLSTNRAAQQQFGFGRKNEAWASRIRGSISLAESIEDLAPAVAQDAPRGSVARAQPQHEPVSVIYPNGDRF
jgi:hypothetical protein